ncbi:MAG: sigma-70 family RNA polymerase sigma factor [Planctomycetaceae bacterium]|nr:sigma-70 family RNA polymerase sigma factor [Planctomycetaceae bacterium]
MADEPSFQAFLKHLDEDDDQAAKEIFNRFSRRLVIRAHRRLSAHVKQKHDAEDVVQSVFRTFFRRQSEGQFEFTDWSGIWGLLVLLTVRKCGHKAENVHAARRDVRREVSSDALREATEGQWEPADREPTADEISTLEDTVEQLMERLEPLPQQILTLRLEGLPIEEISQQTGCSERTVFRNLNRIKSTLSRLCGLDDEIAPTA